jgi:hypothetical protein
MDEWKRIQIIVALFVIENWLIGGKKMKTMAFEIR